MLLTAEILQYSFRLGIAEVIAESSTPRFFLRHSIVIAGDGNGNGRELE